MRRIQRHVNATCFPDGQHGHQNIDRRRHANGDWFLGRHSRGDEIARELVTARTELAVGDLFLLKRRRQRRWSLARERLEKKMYWLFGIVGLATGPLDSQAVCIGSVENRQPPNGDIGLRNGGWKNY